MAYQILTDSGSDLPRDMLEALHVGCLPLTLNFRGASRPDSVDDGIAEFYDALRHGEAATTSAVNPGAWKEAMERVLRTGDDLLVLASTTAQSAQMAAQELRDMYPARTIHVVDTLCASLGQGLLVYYACRKRDEGMSLDELRAWCEENRLHLCHWFTVDDLMFLRRGGRISAATALAGTMLGIKPLLHVDDEGHLINIGKVRGRKASLDGIVKKLEELGGEYDHSTVFICHGDCLADAEYIRDRVQGRFGVEQVYIGYTGAVIGSHSGPGTLALFFLGEHR